MAPPTPRLSPRLRAKNVWTQGPETSKKQHLPQGKNCNIRKDRRNPVATGGDQTQDQMWNSGRDRVGHFPPDQTWIPGRSQEQDGVETVWVVCQEQGPVEDWVSDGDEGHNQAWGADRDPAGGQGSSGTEQVWGSGQNQDQTWSETSRDREHIWRPELNMKKVQRGSVELSPPPDSSWPPGVRQPRLHGAGVCEGSTLHRSDEQKPPVSSIKKDPPTYPAGSEEERWQIQIVAKGRVSCPKCKSVSRKTVEGLKKHMENCRQQPFTCQHCGKQLKSSTGMKYHIMADHSHLPLSNDAKDLDDRVIKEKLRKILKRLGKLKCSKEGCNAAFSSIMGYVYHMRKCGKQESELEKLLLNCSHCGKPYKSKAGLEYHLRSEHAPMPLKSDEDEAQNAQSEANPERTASGRVQRASAQVANFHLAEIANNELPKDWPKRKFQSDLVPDDKKLKYARPGLPAFSQDVLRKWKNEVKLRRKVKCPNQGCCSTYTSVSGLKAHLGLCTKGEFEAGKYRCLICNKEFNSESGVKYHINSIHSEDWFVTNKKAFKKFEKFLKNQSRDFVHNVAKQGLDRYHHSHLQHHHCPHHQQLQQPLQPLHHLQHQTQYLHQDQQNPPPLVDAQPQQQLLHYIQLEPPPGSVWVEMNQKEEELVPEYDPEQMEKAEEDPGATLEERREVEEAEEKSKDAFRFIDGGSAGQSEAATDQPVET
ncbi:zinc finger protein 512-like isoform X2 [Takifugu rubripes]|nr:zinc finger protein 512 isoform X2 [Takifugu rubripes]|eukprot:XP_011610065.1 PREDICTED: zinc finger protein 512 isoform X2 [Takifugu rubripes]